MSTPDNHEHEHNRIRNHEHHHTRKHNHNHRHDLVVLDMAGTTVADGGLVEEAFTAAAERLGEDPAAMIGHVRATMGESKISVFRHLFGGDETRARRPTSPSRRPTANWSPAAGSPRYPARPRRSPN